MAASGARILDQRGSLYGNKRRMKNENWMRYDVLRGLPIDMKTGTYVKAFRRLDGVLEPMAWPERARASSGGLPYNDAGPEGSDIASEQLIEG